LYLENRSAKKMIEPLEKRSVAMVTGGISLSPTFMRMKAMAHVITAVSIKKIASIIKTAGLQGF
jgi:hypothetical protein